MKDAIRAIRELAESMIDEGDQSGATRLSNTADRLSKAAVKLDRYYSSHILRSEVVRLCRLAVSMFIEEAQWVTDSDTLAEFERLLAKDIQNPPTATEEDDYLSGSLETCKTILLDAVKCQEIDIREIDRRARSYLNKAFLVLERAPHFYASSEEMRALIHSSLFRSHEAQEFIGDDIFAPIAVRVHDRLMEMRSCNAVS